VLFKKSLFLRSLLDRVIVNVANFVSENPVNMICFLDYSKPLGNSALLYTFRVFALFFL
jgi:hypothetical protein